MRSRSAVVSLVLVLLAPAVVAAQAPPPPGYPQPGYPPPGYPQPGYPQPGYPTAPAPAHRGFYIGFSLGAGGLQFTTKSGMTSTRENSVALTILRLGGALTERFLVGANLGGWSKTFSQPGGDTSVTLVRINLEAIYYPVLNPQGVDVFVRGGLGTAQLSQNDANGNTLLKEKGGAAQVGVGLEHKLSRSFALGGSLDWHFAALSNNLDANYWEAAAQFTWY